MVHLHVRDGVVCNGILRFECLSRQSICKDINISCPGGCRVPIVVLGDDLVDLGIVHIGLIPGLALFGVLQGHRAGKIPLVHTGRQFHRLGIGQILIGLVGSVGVAVDEIGLIGGLHVVIEPVLWRNISERHCSGSSSIFPKGFESHVPGNKQALTWSPLIPLVKNFSTWRHENAFWNCVNAALRNRRRLHSSSTTVSVKRNHIRSQVNN